MVTQPRSQGLFPRPHKGLGTRLAVDAPSSARGLERAKWMAVRGPTPTRLCWLAQVPRHSKKRQESASGFMQPVFARGFFFFLVRVLSRCNSLRTKKEIGHFEANWVYCKDCWMAPVVSSATIFVHRWLLTIYTSWILARFGKNNCIRVSNLQRRPLPPYSWWSEISVVTFLPHLHDSFDYKFHASDYWVISKPLVF